MVERRRKTRKSETIRVRGKNQGAFSLRTKASNYCSTNSPPTQHIVPCWQFHRKHHIINNFQIVRAWITYRPCLALVAESFGIGKSGTVTKSTGERKSRGTQETMGSPHMPVHECSVPLGSCPSSAQDGWNPCPVWRWFDPWPQFPCASFHARGIGFLAHCDPGGVVPSLTTVGVNAWRCPPSPPHRKVDGPKKFKGYF